MDDKRFLATSSRNGITFFSRIFPFLAVESYYDENDKLESRVHLDPSTVNYEVTVSPMQACQIMDLTFCSNTIVIILALIMIMFSESFDIIIVGTAAAMFCFVQKGLFAYYFFHMFNIYNIINSKSNGGKARAIGRFHGAEHKALNAYEKLGRVPNFEEVKKESRLAKDCGSLVHFNKIVLDTFYCALIIIYSWIIRKIFVMMSIANQNDAVFVYSKEAKIVKMIIAILILVAMLKIYGIIRKVVIKNSLLRFLEIFVTEEPTEKEINAAINGIENLEAAEYTVLKGMVQKIYSDL